MKLCKVVTCDIEVENPYEKYCGMHSLQCDICKKQTDDVYSINGIDYCHACYDDDSMSPNDYENQQLGERQAIE